MEEHRSLVYDYSTCSYLQEQKLINARTGETTNTLSLSNPTLIAGSTIHGPVHANHNKTQIYPSPLDIQGFFERDLVNPHCRTKTCISSSKVIPKAWTVKKGMEVP